MVLDRERLRWEWNGDRALQHRCHKRLLLPAISLLTAIAWNSPALPQQLPASVSPQLKADLLDPQSPKAPNSPCVEPAADAFYPNARIPAVFSRTWD
jgi:hypothetical protein